MGHALQHAIHDAVIRYKRMRGFRTLCLPGTDHAGIGTQMKVEQEIWENEKKTRRDIGRRDFVETDMGLAGKIRQHNFATVARIGL